MARKESGRDLAAVTLQRVRRDGAYASLALAAELRKSRISPQERRLATELVYGVLRHRRRLDHALQRQMRRRIDRTDPETLDQLRLAAYQLLMLDRVPDYAAVDHAVSATRRVRGPRVAGFVNAVLRKVSREGEDLPPEAMARLAVECSLPDDLARYWVRQMGADGARRAALALLERAPLSIRVNSLKSDVARARAALGDEGVRAEPGQWVGSALRIHAGEAVPFDLPSFRDGLWSVQDEAAQLVSLVVDPRPGETVLDACAGVGGKSAHLAALMQNSGRLVCVDQGPAKLELLREQCQRLGVANCEDRAGDLRGLDFVSGLQADRVLVDAPCSGLGVLRRHPELKWRQGAGLAALSDLVPLQRDLLSAAVSALRPGGVLVYSVCTLTDEEGPGQRRWLLGRYPRLSPLPFPGGLPDLGADEAISEPASGSGGSQDAARLWPHRSGTDGFYIARFVLSE